MSWNGLTRGRTLLIGLGCVLALGVIGQIINANVLNTAGDPAKYGQLDVPGSKVLQLPSASFEGILEDPLEEEVKITPALRLSIEPLGGGAAPTISRDVGERFGTANGEFGPDTNFKRVWRIEVPRAGRYRVSVGGAGPDPGYLLDLGHSPPAGPVQIWIWTGIAALIVLALWLLARGAAYLRRSSVETTG
jgi:amino acid transporter